MAGKRKNWTTDEILLALDLYLRAGLVEDDDPEVIELSNLLQTLPIHPVDERTPNFRNPNGVALKLANIANADPNYLGKPTNGSALDKKVYAEWADRPEELKKIVEIIKAGSLNNLAPESDEDEIEAAEGRLLYRKHRVRERDPQKRKQKIAAVLKKEGKLCCEACGFDFHAVYGERGNGYIECHHVVPLHESGEVKTKLSDLALLCSNCHRMVHRRAPWPTPVELAELISPSINQAAEVDAVTIEHQEGSGDNADEAASTPGETDFVAPVESEESESERAWREYYEEHGAEAHRQAVAEYED